MSRLTCYERKSPFLQGGGHFGGTFQVEGDVPINGTAECAGLENAGLSNDGLEMTNCKLLTYYIIVEIDCDKPRSDCSQRRK